MRLVIKNILGYIMTICVGVGCIWFVKELENRLVWEEPKQEQESDEPKTKVKTFDEEYVIQGNT